MCLPNRKSVKEGVFSPWLLVDVIEFSFFGFLYEVEMEIVLFIGFLFNIEIF
jgi:hypothetical protein